MSKLIEETDCPACRVRVILVLNRATGGKTYFDPVIEIETGKVVETRPHTCTPRQRAGRESPTRQDPGDHPDPPEIRYDLGEDVR